ncbi:MAG: hypothetical protein IT385_23810 [Deltaproteobacteria bacterium]|nr:hypothetical protein [Deltaproteobacteria bacterium]
MRVSDRACVARAGRLEEHEQKLRGDASPDDDLASKARAAESYRVACERGMCDACLRAYGDDVKARDPELCIALAAMLSMPEPPDGVDRDPARARALLQGAVAAYKRACTLSEGRWQDSCHQVEVLEGRAAPKPVEPVVPEWYDEN